MEGVLPNKGNQFNPANEETKNHLFKAIEASGISLWTIEGTLLTIWPGSDLSRYFSKKPYTLNLTPDEIDKLNLLEGNHHFKPAMEGLFNGKICNIDLEIGLPINHHIVWALIKGAVIEMDGQNRPLLIAGSILDCTTRHQQEKLIKMSEAKYQHIFQQSKQAFCINSITPSGPGLFIEANPSALELFDCSLDTLLKNDFFQLIQVHDDDEQERICKRVLNCQQIQMNVQIKHQNGDILDIELNSNVILLDGFYVMLSVLKDITKLLETQRELNKAQKKAEESERLKAAFLENISHELRTPMNAIVGFSNLLSIDEIDKKTREEYVSIITNNTQLLLRLINDILDVSKIESGVLKILPKKVNLGLVMQNLNDIFQNELVKLNKSHLKLIPVLPDDIHEINIITDPIRISQILNNLLYNAIKFTDNGFVKFGLNVGTDHLLFFVQDTGIGILKEKQDVIFEHFRQANDTYAEKNHGGTGLGLSISKKLVELLGGKIWVESQRYIGSTFYFTIPLISEMEEIQEMGPNKAGLNKKTILLVCDDEDEINLFSIYLFASPINLLIARTGEEAMHLLSSNPTIQLVVIHNKLPDMDGIDAAKSYRSIQANMKLVVFDNNFNDFTRRNALSENIPLIKTFTASEKLFIKTLEELIN